jgi:cellulose synthase/poly-beta-1,6-N-acetylglucosamine synthase-like glycosyltransferase
MVKRETAANRLSLAQKVIGALGLMALAAGFVIDAYVTALCLIALCMLFWLVFVGFLKIVLPIASLSYHMPNAVADNDPSVLPGYSILLPVVREKENLEPLVEAMKGLHYPPSKLQVLVLLESDDLETIEAARAIALTEYFEVVVVPSGGPKTKPNALNFGLAKATGERLVVYDAEDRPEADQLLKAVATLQATPEDVVCAQARLSFWNRTSSWITRFYWTEYVMHFEWVLAGLSKQKMVPPLGGTSNHFVTAALRKVAIDSTQLPFSHSYEGGWDPWNVTEDAELGGALALHGYRTVMFDSVTYESACQHVGKADKQRRRWLKGYFHTGLVYTRHPLQYARIMGIRKYLVYVLMLIGTPVSLWLNVPFWGATIVYFATHSSTIKQLFPAPLFYCGILLTLVGNLLQFYQMVATCLHRKGETSVKYMILAPVWWLLSTYTAYMALWEFAVKPHHWHKTEHVQDLEQERIELEMMGT